MYRSPYRLTPRPAFSRVQPQPRRFPSGRYEQNNPLRRWFGLRLLVEPLPKAVGAALIAAWMHPGRYDGNQAIQNLYRQRPPEDTLPFLPPSLLDSYSRIELEVSRRVVEIPRTEIRREERDRLLRSQGAYLRALYAALVMQLGEARAQAAFERLLLSGR